MEPVETIFVDDNYDYHGLMIMITMMTMITIITKKIRFPALCASNPYGASGERRKAFLGPSTNSAWWVLDDNHDR